MTKFVSDKFGPIPAHHFENEPSHGPSEFVPAYVPEAAKESEKVNEAERDKYEPGDEVTGY